MRNRGLRGGVGTSIISFVVIILVVAGAVGLVSTLPQGQRTGNETAPNSAATVSSPEGLRLSVSANASVIAVGQRINVSLSIINTLPEVNVVKTVTGWGPHAVPVALWPPCYVGPPAEAAVLQGDYNAQEIMQMTSMIFGYTCAEAVIVDHVIFQPNSDQVNLTGVYDVSGTNESLGPFHTSLSFTTGGYWNLQNLSEEINIPILGQEYPPNPPAFIPFSPGEYTIAVADEWGQVAILHIRVVPVPIQSDTACTTSVHPSSVSGMSDVYVLTPGTTAVVCVDYQFRTSGTYAFSTPDFGPVNGSTFQACGPGVPACKSLSISPLPATVSHAGGDTFTVAYVIQVGADAKGLYWFFIGTCDLIDLTVGYIPTSVRSPVFTGCPTNTNGPTSEVVTGISNISIVRVPLS